MLKPLSLSWRFLLAVNRRPPRRLVLIGFFTWPAKRRDKLLRRRAALPASLNIANRETQGGRPDNARNTLVLARQTLEKADKIAFTDQERLAGWISLCELGREADDKAFAGAALDQAMLALNQLGCRTWARRE